MTVCPACGVAVVPGYVRCPKCHAPLPRHPSTIASGGTAVPQRRRSAMLVVLAIALIGGGLIMYLGVRGGNSAKAAQPEVGPVETAAPTPAPLPAPEPAPAAPPRRPDPDKLASDLETALRKRRLWSTVAIVGARVELRSSSCADPAMKPVIDAAAPSFKSAGLTKLRCLEQSGHVVSERDL